MFTRHGQGAVGAGSPARPARDDGGAGPGSVRPGEAEAARAQALPSGSPRVSVVIPAKNEAANLPGVLGQLPPGLHEVILVDGHSVDGTVRAGLDARPDLVVVRQTRRGKGNALACGFAACTGEVAVMLDADGSADPAEIARFVEALRGGADFVKGSRYLARGGSEDFSVLRRVGNTALVFLMNRLYHTHYSDLCYGYNAFWTRCLRSLALPATEGAEPAYGDGFEIETLLAARAASAGLDIAEVPSFERVRWCGASNLNTWRDGWRVLRTMLRERPGRARRHAVEPVVEDAPAPPTVSTTATATATATAAPPVAAPAPAPPPAASPVRPATSGAEPSPAVAAQIVAMSIAHAHVLGATSARMSESADQS
ncbi:MAG TPA: glycosyltransferase family 2 protein [Actinocrinis sp.]|nr:glycosyltransferase family 2 protein [Actinocrinis sp.]